MSTKPIHEYFFRATRKNCETTSPINNGTKRKKRRLAKKTSPNKKHSKSNQAGNLTPLQKWIRVTTNSPPTIWKPEDTTDKTKTKTDPNKRDKRNKKIDERRDSFARYGVNLPSFDYIMEYKQKVDDLTKCIEYLDSIADVEPVNFSLDEPKTAVPILDCKHLTNEQLNLSLTRNYQYLHDIYYGISASERHARFTNPNLCNSKDLIFNTSMITFTFEQIQLLVHYLSEKFDKSEFGAKHQYFFKVLLPELCTKIFMDTHNMTYEEATTYLDNRPVD